MHRVGQGPWTISIKNAPTYFLTIFPKNIHRMCLASPKMGQRLISALSGEPTRFRFIDSDLGILMIVIGHASLRAHS